MSIVYVPANDVWVDTTNSHITAYGVSWSLVNGQEVRGAKTVVTTLPPVQSAQQQRLAQKNAFTGWENDPTARSDQEQSWDIYVSTGRWDSPEQIQLHADAEAALMAANPTYQGSPAGATDSSMANKIVLPNDPSDITSPGSTANQVLGGVTASQIGGIAVIGLFALMFLGGRH